jgi:hypothetical protein
MLIDYFFRNIKAISLIGRFSASCLHRHSYHPGNNLHEKEFGYFSLKELESIRFPWGLKIERDIHFSAIILGEIYDGD